MKKIVLLCGAMLALTAVAANAQLLVGVTDACGGARTASWGCTANTTAAVVTLSAAATIPAGKGAMLVGVSGEESAFEIAFSGGVVPAWWQLGTGRCRAAAQASFSSATMGTCNTYFTDSQGYGVTPSNEYIGNVATDPRYGMLDGGSIRYNTIASTADPASAGYQPIDGDQVYLFTVQFKGAATTTCAGCNTGACAVLRYAKLTQDPALGDLAMDAGTPMFTQNAIANTVAVPAIGTYLQGGGTLQCPRATEASRSSWGQLKSLYR